MLVFFQAFMAIHGNVSLLETLHQYIYICIQVYIYTRCTAARGKALKPLWTSRQCGIEGFKVGPQSGPHYTGRCEPFGQLGLIVSARSANEKDLREEDFCFLSKYNRISCRIPSMQIECSFSFLFRNYFTKLRSIQYDNKKESNLLQIFLFH